MNVWTQKYFYINKNPRQYFCIIFLFYNLITRSTKHRQGSELRRGGVCQRSNYRNHSSRHCSDTYNRHHGHLLQASSRASKVWEPRSDALHTVHRRNRRRWLYQHFDYVYGLYLCIFAFVHTLKKGKTEWNERKLHPLTISLWIYFGLEFI